MAKKTCNSCSKPSTVPYTVFADLKEVTNRTIKRLWILVIISWLIVFAVVGVFTYERLQYDYVCETTSKKEIVLDGKDGGNANYIGNNGDIINGEGNSKEVNYNGKAEN